MTGMVDFEFEFQYAEAKQTALHKAAGSIPAGRCVVLCGGSGCGKTTLGKLIAGLYKPAVGQITLFGSGRTPKQLQSQVMFIMQEAEFQFFTNSVINELKYGHAATPEFDQAAETLLRRMGMWECRDRHPFSLSGGQMQKLTLMTAFLSEKPVIVLDEPTAGQDAESLDSCAALIREMGREKTVVIITHDLELIAKACTRCIGLAAGGADAQLPVQNERELQAVRRYMEGFRPADAPPVQKSVRERFHGVAVADVVRLLHKLPVGLFALAHDLIGVLLPVLFDQHLLHGAFKHPAVKSVILHFHPSPLYDPRRQKVRSSRRNGRSSGRSYSVLRSPCRGSLQ